MHKFYRLVLAALSGGRGNVSEVLTMYNIGLLALCLLLGVLLRYSKRVPDNAASVLNDFIIHISLPALILLHAHQLTPAMELLFPVAMPWVMFVVGFFFFRLVGRLRAVDAAEHCSAHSYRLARQHFVRRSANDRGILRQ